MSDVGAAEKEIVVAAVAMVRDGAVLTVRKRGTRRFMLVGGKLEPGETAAQAAVRETHEEVGLELGEVTLLAEFTGETANEPGYRLRSTVFSAELPGEPRPCAEIEELRWVGLDEDGDDLAPMLLAHTLPMLRSLRTSRGG